MISIPIRSLSATSAATPPSAGVEASHRMFAPRLGLAYRLGNATVIRAGYGISYDPLPMSRVFRDPFPLTVVQNFTGPNSFVPFGSLETGIPSLTVPDLSTGRAPVPTTAVISRSPFPGMLHRGYIQSWNFTLERQLPGSMVVTAAYVGTATTHQFVDHEMNAGYPGSGTAGLPLFEKFGRTVSTLFEDGWLSSHYHSLPGDSQPPLQPWAPDQDRLHLFEGNRHGRRRRPHRPALQLGSHDLPQRGALGVRHPPQFPDGLGMGSSVREIEALPLPRSGGQHSRRLADQRDAWGPTPGRRLPSRPPARR